MWFATFAGVVIVGWLLWRWTSRPTIVRVAVEPPPAFPEDAFSHQVFEDLLERFVDAQGRVDYDAWHADPTAVAELDSYLAAIARYSPDNAPERFTDDSEQIVYWMHAHNAFVLKGVLLHWPLQSVRDVKAPLQVIRGYGFFFKLRFVAGGEIYSLHQVERQKVLEHGQDPRAHFVLNCGSGGCPAIRPALPTGPALETALTQAASDFISDPRNVAVDHTTKRIRLSSIFKWYRQDFVNDLRRRGLPATRGAVDYVRSLAPEPLRIELEQAGEYVVEYADYDWTINAVRT